MLIKLLIKHHDAIVLLEAEQDTEWKSLEDAADQDAQGLFCGGFATCYAVIFQNNKRTAMAHLSGLCDPDFIMEMFDYVTHSQTLSCETTLARSPFGYLQQQAEDIKQGYKSQDVNEYFAQQDAVYTQFFRKNFKKKPTIVTMSHDFLMIDPTGNIQYFESYPATDIDYEELPTGSWGSRPSSR